MTLNRRLIATALLLLGLGLIPIIAKSIGYLFLLTLFTRIVILAIAAVSLDLILGYGGMISFGHAVFLGIGGYAVGIAAHHGYYSALVQWPIGLAASALFGLITGALCLRTRGVYFIMITLAFSQLVYFLSVGIDSYGSDDGLTIYKRSTMGGLIDLGNKTTFYYVCYACLLLCLFLAWRIVRSPFGRVIQAARSNENRLQVLGIATDRYRLVAYVIASTMCGLSGILLANHTDFISPALIHWTRSGDLMIMVVLGGMGTLFGPVAGTIALLVLEEVLSTITEHWMIVLGPLLLLMALFKRGGLSALLGGRKA